MRKGSDGIVPPAPARTSDQAWPPLTDTSSTPPAKGSGRESQCQKRSSDGPLPMTEGKRLTRSWSFTRASLGTPQEREGLWLSVTSRLQPAPRPPSSGPRWERQLPGPDSRESAQTGWRSKVAVTVRAVVTVTAQSPVPEQAAPVQPVKTEPAAGLAARVTTEPD